MLRRKETTMPDISEDFIAQVATLYAYAGLTHLLEALQTVLLRQHADAERLNFDTQELVEAIAHVRKAAQPLTDGERATIHRDGIRWSPRPDPT